MGKVTVALRNSIDTYESQEKIRKKERAVRFTEAQEIREDVTGADWRRRAKGPLKGEYAKLGIQPLQQVMDLEVFESLDQDLRTSEKLTSIEAIKLGDSLEALFKKGEIFQPHIKIFKKIHTKITTFN